MTNMKNTHKIVKIGVAVALGLSQIALVTLPVYAATGSTTLGARLDAKAALQTTNDAARIARIRESANKEIDRRTASLTELSTRIGEMKHESDADKATLTGMVSAELTSLATLKAKIAADTDLATLKTDTQSITKSYRVYMLVMPSIRIIAAADRVVHIVGDMSALGTKLSARITLAATEGNDVTKLTLALTDFNAKLVSAKTQAQAAVTGIGGLTPDNGDKTKMEANKAALKAAREKLKLAETDLKAARADVKTIIEGLKVMKKVATTTPATTN